MDNQQIQWIKAALGAALLLVGCQQQTREEVVARERAENPQVGIALAGVPEFFRVEINEGERFILVPREQTISGRLSIVAGEAGPGGVNLVAAVQQHQEGIEALEGAVYKGQRELGTPLGTAYYSRGRYPADGGQTTEETVVFLVHPSGDRTLQLIYRYPAGDDSAERLQDQLFSLVAELEPLPGTPEESAEEGVSQVTEPG